VNVTRYARAQTALRRLKVAVLIRFRPDTRCRGGVKKAILIVGGQLWSVSKAREAPVLRGNACFILDEEHRCPKGRKFLKKGYGKRNV